jgi:hypothetical protein
LGEGPDRLLLVENKGEFMKNVLLVLILASLLAPSLALAQAPCKCSPRSGTIIRPYFPVEYPIYETPCHGVGRQHQRGPYAVNSTPGGVPFTVRNVLRTLDCLIPAGPRSGHGSGLYCIGAGSGCIKGAAHRDIIYCPYCGAPPFSCNCCGNGKAVYAPPAPVLRSQYCEPAYAEDELLAAPSEAIPSK